MRKELESFIDAEGTRFWRVWFQIVRREACVAPGEISGTQRPDGPFASVRKSRAIGGIIRADARPVPVLRTRSPKSHAAQGSSAPWCCLLTPAQPRHICWPVVSGVRLAVVTADHPGRGNYGDAGTVERVAPGIPTIPGAVMTLCGG